MVSSKKAGQRRLDCYCFVVMQTAILSVSLIALIMAVMAVGVIFGRKPLQGSCGGVGADCLCEKRGVPKQCEELREAAARLKAEQPDARL